MENSPADHIDHGGESSFENNTANITELTPATSHPKVNSLRELIDYVAGRSSDHRIFQEDAGYAERIPFPFLALVGQVEMKLALLLSVVNPLIGGVLLIGPRGTGKTTAVRSISELLPETDRSICFYGCLPEDIETGGIDAVCPDCAKKYAEGKPLTRSEMVQIIELPLNAELEDVIGGLDERVKTHERFRLKRGILSRADQNLLYIDEVNLLVDEIIDAILDASAQQFFTVRRGVVSATYKSRFTLIGSMNPEEGHLRPQIMDRFGLRVHVRGLKDPNDRLKVYNLVKAYRESPRAVNMEYTFETNLAQQEIQSARDLLKSVKISKRLINIGLDLIQTLHIESSRAEITLFEAARAYAAAANRKRVTLDDLETVAPMALRLRGSEFMMNYFKQQDQLEEQFNEIFQDIAKKNK